MLTRIQSVIGGKGRPTMQFSARNSWFTSRISRPVCMNVKFA